MLINTVNANSYIDYLDTLAKVQNITTSGLMSLLYTINVDYIENDYNARTYSGYTPFNYPNLPIFYNNIMPFKTPSTPENENSVVKQPPPSKKTKQIQVDAENVQTPRDLLDILDKYSPIDQDAEYSIDIQCLHNIRKELQELDSMIGMTSLKQSIIHQLLYFMMFEAPSSAGEDTCQGDFKHTVLYGPPGTGKTEIAQIIGRMYSKIGVLKNQKFNKVTRSDLIAGYLGQTAIKTKKAIEDCLGGVLFIDEAYSLASATSNDSFSKECIDTLCESLSNYKSELMVIIAGYEDELERDFFTANPGLESRFIWRFHIEAYTSSELRSIFKKMMYDNLWNLADESVAPVEWFEKHKDQFKHYGRDMELLFFYVKISHSKRIFGKPISERRLVTNEDMNAGLELFKKNKTISKKAENVRKIFETMYI